MALLVKEAASLLNCNPGVLRLEALFDIRSWLVAILWVPVQVQVVVVPVQEGQVQEVPWSVVNPPQLLLKQTLPDRDQGSERIREVD